MTGDWHGFQFGELGTLHIGPLPTRKSIALYLIQGSVMHVLAYFRDEDEARRLLSFLDGMFAPVEVS